MVIVVVAILASLPYIGYTNVGNRANDSAVKSDLANFAKQLQLHYAGSGSFPRGGATISSSGATLAGSVVTSPGISLKIAHKSYHEQLEIGSANFIYCSGPALICGSAAFNILERVGLEKSICINHQLVLSPAGYAMTGSDACQGIGYPRSFSYGYSTNAGGWQPWGN